MSRAPKKEPRVGVVPYGPGAHFAVLWLSAPYTSKPALAVLAGSLKAAIKAISEGAASLGLTGDIPRNDTLAAAVARELLKIRKPPVLWHDLVGYVDAPSCPPRKPRPVIGYCLAMRGFFWAAWPAGSRGAPAVSGTSRTDAEAIDRLNAWLQTQGETWDRARKNDERVRAFFEKEAPPYTPPPQWSLPPLFTSPPIVVVDLQALGLRWPASIEELRKAFRVRALETHPDRGGRTEDFIAVRTAYEAGMRAHGGKP